MISEAIARRALKEYQGRFRFPFVDHFEVRQTQTGNFAIFAILRRPLHRGEYVPSPIVVNDFGKDHRVVVKTELKRG